MDRVAPPARSGTAGARAAYEAECARGSACSAVTLVDALLAYACEARASDVHIIPTAAAVRTRLRIDGELMDAYPFPRTIEHEFISRIKVLANLRTDEHHAAQDGRFTWNGSHGLFDVRVSIMPTYYGENAVLRLLTNHGTRRSLDALGFTIYDRERVREALGKKGGMVLATGPTGSGKTTTLYALIEELNSNEVSVITVEDPIEYSIDAVEQVQVNPRTGLTFESGLRAILRQDPDIIMVGEIRDRETARIAVNAALTGHLLLSTLHTNDAVTTLPRLADIGIDPYLIAATIEVAIAQRLVRTLCESCRDERSPSAEEMAYLKSRFVRERIPTMLPFGNGCDACQGSGYVGRTAVYEVLVADSVLRDAIVRRASSRELQDIAGAFGMRTMLEDGLEKVHAGHTTLTEIVRVTQ